MVEYYIGTVKISPENQFRDSIKCITKYFDALFIFSIIL